MPEHVVVPGWMWLAFAGFVITVLALDLGIFNRKAHTVHFKEALTWTCVWVSLAFVFCGMVYFWYGKEKALQFMTGYVIEEALSVDNLFVFILIFNYFRIPSIFQHRVLFWGILGALAMRAIFIFVGSALIQKFHWLLWVFGGFLILTGIKILIKKEEEEQDLNDNFAVKLFRRFVPTVSEFHGPRFLIEKEGKRYATPLFLALVIVEVSDLIFAVDSIPAVFAVTTDPFIVYTSNIFAILGLRSLYFLLAGIMDKFRYLKYGLGFVLTFVGVKMLLPEEHKIPTEISLLVIVALLALAMLASILIKPKEEPPKDKQL